MKPTRRFTHRAMLSMATLAAATALAADLEAGKRLGTTVCAACHGANGSSTANHIPNLAGQRLGYLVGQLRAFKDQSRKHDVMNPIAAQLTVEDIANLAAHFASLPPAAGGARSAYMPSLATTKVTIPADFPAGFTRYLTIPREGGKLLNIFYANEVALRAAQAGNSLPDGATIISISQGVKLDANQKPMVSADGRPLLDKIVGYSAMASGAGWGDDIPMLIRNGNWDFGLFTADRQARPGLNYAECFACHKPKAPTSFLFTHASLVSAQ